MQIDRTRKGSPSRRLELPITETVNGGMSQEELSEAQELEKQLSYQDKLIERTKDAKNALESYVYEVRNKVIKSSWFVTPVHFLVVKGLIAYLC